MPYLGNHSKAAKLALIEVKTWSMHQKSNRMLAKRKPNLNLLETQTEFLHICIAGYVMRSYQVDPIHVFVPSKNASIETSKMRRIRSK